MGFKERIRRCRGYAVSALVGVAVCGLSYGLVDTTLAAESCSHNYFMVNLDWKAGSDTILQKDFRCKDCNDMYYGYIDFGSLKEHEHIYKDGFCEICGAKDPNSGQHTHTYVTTVVPPTCTDRGYTLHECECGDNYKDTYVDALGHSYKDGSCEVCGAKDPDWTGGEHSHAYTATVVPPTCEDQGYTIHECECGDSYKDTYVDALGHDYRNAVCDNCGATEVSDYGLFTVNGDKLITSWDELERRYHIDVTVTGNPTSVLNNSGVNPKNEKYVLKVPVVNEIASGAFNDISNMASVEFTGGTSFSMPFTGKSLFYGCDDLESIILPKTTGCSFYGEDGYLVYSPVAGLKILGRFPSKKNIVGSFNPSSKGITNIASNAFSGNSNLTSLVLNSVGISDYAFEDCTSLLTVRFDTVYIGGLGKGAFKGCTSLHSVTWDSSKMSESYIPDEFFMNCGSLSVCNLPTYNISGMNKPLSYIGRDSFRGCSSLSLTLSSVTEVRENATLGCKEVVTQ